VFWLTSLSENILDLEGGIMYRQAVSVKIILYNCGTCKTKLRV